MDILAAATIVALVVTATTLFAFIFERRMDVLHGPYIEGRELRLKASAWTIVRSISEPAMDRLRWKARNVPYITCLFAC
jgi:hypothetical protein